jgi:hypothetical protein
MNNLTVVRDIERDYNEALRRLEEIKNLVPTFKILGHAYVYNSIQNERRHCGIIMNSVIHEEPKEAIAMLAKVPHNEKEIEKISSMIYLDKNKVNIVTEKHLNNCKVLMTARLERIKMMQEAYC